MINHLVFVEPERDLETALVGSYAPELVILSVFIAVLFTYTAFLISAHRDRLGNTPHKKMWLAAGSLSLGGGVWGMHFVGMLAYKLPVSVNYDVIITFLSMIPAVLASLVVIQTNHNDFSFKRLLMRSVLMGGGIGCMHYIGMAAMNVDGDMRYDLGLFILSVVVAVTLAMASLRLQTWARKRDDGNTQFISPPLLFAATMMGIAISGMHYTGMTAMYVFPNDISPIEEMAWPPDTLANLLAIFSLLIGTILIITLNASRKLNRSQKREEKEIRKRISAQKSLEARQFIIDQHAIVVMTDLQGSIIYTNDKYSDICGYSANELLGGNPRIFNSGYRDKSYWRKMYRTIIAGKMWHDEIKNRAKNGEFFWLNSTIASLQNIDGQPEGYIAIYTDITKQKKIQEELENHQNELELLVQKRTAELEQANETLKKLSEIDPLTQIANRRVYEKTLRNEIYSAKRSKHPLTLLMIDVDHFKEYNDNYGHDVGDDALKSIAQTLAQALPRKTDLAARYGGEEFAVLMPVTDCEGGNLVAELIRINIKALDIKHEYSAVNAMITVSIGIASLKGDALNEESLFRHADKALYRAKNAGKNRCEIYR